MEWLIWLMAGGVFLSAAFVVGAAYRLHMVNDAIDGPCAIHRLPDYIKAHRERHH